MNAEAPQPKETQPVTKQALEKMYSEHSSGLYRYAYRILGDQALAEDCVSETFSRLLQKVRRGQGRIDNPQAYLYRTAHNWSMDQHRSRDSHTLPLDPTRASDESRNPAKVAAERATHERVRAAILELPDEQRQVILLRVLENMPHKQVAEILGKTAQATRALQYRGLGSLRARLLEMENSDE